MIREKILEKLKPKKKGSEHKDEGSKQSELKGSTQPETKQDSVRPIIAEYSETLYSEDTPSEKKSLDMNKKNILSKQRLWRDVESIEENVNNISKSSSETLDTGLDKTIDRIIAENKLRKRKKPRKASNVIYVVSKPQPGQVRGDWAVRSHRKIYSHHRIKENAIKEARNIARERNATVLIQNTDGTFSEGFKPRQKK